MLGNAAASDGEPSLLSRTSNVEELFRHHFRTVERIYNACGTAGVRQHRDNISGACLVSLFSGLGGAELAAGCVRGWVFLLRIVLDSLLKFIVRR